MGAGAQKSGGAAALPAPPPPRSLLPHIRFCGGDISDVSGCCLSPLLFLAKGVTEEKLTVLSIFNH